MLDKLIEEYANILDKDPLDQSEDTYAILHRFANKIIQETINDLGQSKYYKPATIK